ncbi:MAG TPA: lysylphosphatidylglycerol synthase transmembrane domain-containing protein [Polyangiales bacterium]|nr:lysylphosphatidylglycerol synthase transmembrane domain-containing protein [Polyangiales bacterium]
MPTPAPKSKLRAVLGVVARLVVTGLVFGFLFSRIDVQAVGQSVTRIPVAAAVASVVSLLVALLISVVRWRGLLAAAGAQSLPSWVEACRLYLVGMFYNLLPGAVGGDVYRGYAARHCFDGTDTTRSVSVVFVERVCGFAGLLVLAALATLATPIRNPLVLAYSGAGLLAALGAVVALTVGRRLSGKLPARLGRIAASLPAIEAGPLLLALALSVVTHVAVSMTGYTVLASLAPHVTFAQGMAVFPLGTLAAYFPLTVAGAGARDTALVVLLAEVGVSREDALATSLSMLACNLLVSGMGGLVQRGKSTALHG